MEGLGKKAVGLHPDLLQRLARVFIAMDALGFPMRLTDGVRTAEQQHLLWEIGRERPGHIVTNADGYEKRSNHQMFPDGYGHAADCAFVDPADPTKISWGNNLPWDTYGACCRAVGLRWGIKLNARTVDRPHAELT